MHRFFVSPAAIEGDRVSLSRQAAHQIGRVLRLRKGMQFIVLDDSGWEYTVELEHWSQEGARGRIVARAEVETEPRAQITLYQAVLKGERFEWVLQKGTELGVAAFVPLLCAYNVVRDAAAVRKKSARWRAIIREAAEQSRRGRLPRLEPSMAFAAACQQAETAGGLSLLAWEGESAVSMKDVLRAQSTDDEITSTTVQPPTSNLQPPTSSLQLFIGPEGGFTPGEVEWAQAHGIHSITLGRRTLRAETAAIAAVAVAFYELGEWG
jgi:16S rRNA (uracil1498-N3)-methyltransferase